MLVRYNTTQILSVLLVMIGVIITTLSAQPSSKTTTTIDPYTYAKGIGILTLALILSGFLGLLQDWTHPKPTLKSSQPIAHAVQQADPGAPAAWQESMFYLHFLALPMFLSLLPDLAAQMHELNMSSQRAEVKIPLPTQVSVNLTRTSIFPVPIHILPYQEGTSLLSIVRSQNEDTDSPILLSLSIPYVYLPLIINTITQLLCVAGVHRLTTRVSAVTVTLVLVVRKAVSLIISVVGIAHLGRTFRDWIYLGLDSAIVFFGWDKEIKTEDWGFQSTGLERFLTTLGTALTGVGSAKKPQAVDKTMMWLGALMVMLGTFGYTLGSRAKAATRKEKAE
jgi:UDP-xylose/UDP-N-acetylglucosamine transporter B4